MWCSTCGKFLAFVHLFDGVTLLMIDISSNYLSNNPVDISIGFLFIVCAILCFITTRRLDGCVLQVLAAFAFFSLTAAMYLFVDNMIFLNNQCVKQGICSRNQELIHSQIAFVSLCEMVTSMASLLLCYKSKLEPDYLIIEKPTAAQETV
ncbi:unnamed protein product [Caenorhabditis angaria]|uniref:Uncharacterized protein n=1 Tax=Caenorhabditis angaria TaxID=860376 RepID=A0A9P1MW12_9PELO|nr:unnamed protein product [Caenorhabditis angaria]